MKVLILMLLQVLSGIDNAETEQRFCTTVATYSEGRITCERLRAYADQQGIDPNDTKTGISNGF